MTAQLSDAPDPVTVEIVTHRLHEITTEIATTLERVGGTVNTAQMEDYIATIYRADGALLSAGERASWHTYCAGKAVREVIQSFEGLIRPGDMFLLNDPYRAAIHQSDIYLISPIHLDGELVAWSATFVHVMDVGATSPGGNSPAAREVEQEGLRFGALRIVEDGQLRTDVVTLLVGMTRQPEMVGLDIRCQIAANFVARDRMVQMYRRYGKTLLEGVYESNIAASRRVLEERLAEIEDCELHDAVTILLSPTDSVTLACTLRKQGRSVEFDFTDSSPQSCLGVNLPEHGTYGACAQVIYDTLARDVNKTEGLLAPIRLRTKPGTVVACTYPAPVSLNTTSGGAAAKCVAQQLVSLMVAGSERWRDTARPRSLGRRAARHAGRSQHGGLYVSTIHSLNGGFPTFRQDGGECSRGETTSHNAEWLEANFPLLHLYRRIRVDSAGAGTFRGGAAEETAYMLHDAPEGYLRLVAHGLLGNATAGDGMFGGYPGSPSELLVYKSQGVTGDVAGERSGRLRVPWYEELVLGRDDLLVLRSSAGPGMGDPLLRAPDRVLRDVRLQRVTPGAARSQYGVVIVEGAIDVEATNAVRAGERAARHRAAVAAGWRDDVALASGLDLGCDPTFGVCRQTMASIQLDVRAGELPVVRTDAATLGWRHAEGHPEMAFTQTYCPVCWSLIDCRLSPREVAGDPTESIIHAG